VGLKTEKLYFYRYMIAVIKSAQKTAGFSD